MPTLWFISVPANPSVPAALSSLRTALSADLCAVAPLALPEFKIGTLDGLLGVSDDLGRLDSVCEGLCIKMAELVRGLVTEEAEEKAGKAGGDAGRRAEVQVGKLLTVGRGTFEDYVKGFGWNASLYRSDRPIADLTAALAKDTAQLDSTLRTRTQAYSQLKTSLQALERRSAGTWAVRSLTDIVRVSHVDALDSEYLVTLFVAVPKVLEKAWWASYERLTEYIVPRSSRIIAQDSEFLLVNVTVFRRVMSEFIVKCRDERFMVRDFTYEEGRAERDSQELNETKDAKRAQRAQLAEWARGIFGEAVQAWVHVKVLRAYVESVLRYGLPPVYIAAVVEPKKGMEGRLVKRMAEKYAHLGRKFNAGDIKKAVSSDRADEGFDAAAMAAMGDEGEYKDYVWFELKWQPDGTH